MTESTQITEAAAAARRDRLAAQKIEHLLDLEDTPENRAKLAATR